MSVYAAGEAEKQVPMRLDIVSLWVLEGLT